ncbi:hypothetical protein CTRI78_v002936 [Colletotrichum trifolii]|uniref:Aminoglycoside phosphotransferase domain-containing protein n=1 Tax=Colletotrichum trifolii TaxID=5466 RepID=A0A4R8RL21_COLTR|nr:hypothetical protein CTRI78_v002936 [Colletotrichum trifolii]
MSSSLPEAPPHPRDWNVGVDEYLRQNGISCDEAVPLNTSTSCYIWQINGLKDAEATANGHEEGQPAILKCADSTPKYRTFSVSPERLRFEVKALGSAAVKKASLQEPSVRVPRVLRTTRNGFVMNWVGQTDLRTAYKNGRLADAADAGRRLGRWLGCLHLAGVELGPDGWDLEHGELRQFYVPGGLAERAIKAAMDGEEEEAGRVLAAMRAPAPVHTLTPWDFRPMNVVVRLPDDGDKVGVTGLSVVDWELCHYGDPADDVRMWVAEVMILEAKFGERGLLSSFLRAYREQAGASLVDGDFVSRVALSVGIYVLWLVPINPGVWDCTEQDVEAWKSKSLEFIRAGAGGDVEWIKQSCLAPLLD